jgi:hypothetical protein
MTIGIRELVRLTVGLGLLIALGSPAPAAAHDPEDEQAAESADAEEEEGPNTGRISLWLQNDLTNVYFFRGILNERDGYIWQPVLELYVNLFESEDGPIRSVTIGGGVWNSYHEEKTLAVNSPQHLYETDWYPLLEVGLPAGFSLNAYYYYYTSPNGAFDTVQELNLGAAWDDSEVFGRFAVQPWINFAIETQRTSFGNHEGSLFQIGIEPTLYEHDSEDWAFAFTLPVEMGLAINNYYEEESPTGGHDEDTLGYVSYGVTASLPISSIPAEFGSWTASVTGKGYYLHEALARFNRGDHNYGQVVGSLSLEY